MVFPTTDKKSLQRYYNSELYSDVCIDFAERKIHAHRLILAEASNYFKGAFERGFKVNLAQILGEDSLRYKHDRHPRNPEKSHSSSTTTTPTPFRP